MKKFALAILVLMIAGAAQGTAIYDIQAGNVDENTLVTPCDVVVTAVTYNGIWVAEAPYGAMNGIWVYMGSDEPIDLVAGDIVCICGEYKEYFDLSEIDIVSAGIYGSVLKTGEMEVPLPSLVAAADLGEEWESCVVTVLDGMAVTELPNDYGEWLATATDGTVVIFDDIFYDDTTVTLEDCYNSATGVLNYTFGDFKLEVFEDGLEIVPCGVATENVAFDQVKALYR